MTDLTKAVAEAKKFKAMFGGVLEIADELEKLGDLEQRKNEVADQKAAMERAVEQAKADLAEAVGKAEQAQTDANEYGERVRSEADAYATETRSKADEEAADIRTTANIAVTKKRRELADIEALKVTAQAALDAKNVEVSAAQAKLNELNEQIDALVAKLKG